MQSKFPGYFPADPVQFESIDPVDVHERRRGKILVFACFLVFFTSIMFPRHPISGSSMNPTYVNGQQAFCARTMFGALGRNSVVVAYPGDGKLIIKRVAAIPGDTLVISPDGSVTVNGEAYTYGMGSAYASLMFEDMTPNEDGSFSVTLGDGEYYLLGDNHENSADSRYYGIFQRSAILETVMFVF